MSRQLAISATLSILAMLSLALAAPSMADQADGQVRTETGATAIVTAAPDFAG